MGTFVRNYFECGPVVQEMMSYFFNCFFYFFALVAILFTRAEPFVQFW